MTESLFAKVLFCFFSIYFSDSASILWTDFCQEGPTDNFVRAQHSLLCAPGAVCMELYRSGVSNLQLAGPRDLFIWHAETSV